MNKNQEAYEELLDLCRGGCLDPMDVLVNVLVNYLPTDASNDFAMSEYDCGTPDYSEEL